MPVTDTGSSGGGSTTNFCAPTPSDMAGQINNIISRLTALENAVSELQGQNTSANQLSDISAQVGWVYNVTYLGIPGWTQTEAGTLIPPAGFTLTQILADAQAAQLAANATAGINGAGGGASSAWYENYGAHNLVGAAGVKYLDFTADEFSDPNSLAALGSIGTGGETGNQFTIASDGIYLMNFHFEIETPGISDFGEYFFDYGLGGWATSDVDTFAFDQTSVLHYSSSIQRFVTRIAKLDAGDECSVHIQNSSSGGNYFTWFGFGIIKLA